MYLKKPIFFLFFALYSFSLPADCMKATNGQVYCGKGHCQQDIAGRVHCSKYELGGAATSNTGKVVCGKGACLQDKSGKVYCSSEHKGGIALNTNGLAKCYKSCVVGTTDMCEAELGM